MKNGILAAGFAAAWVWVAYPAPAQDRLPIFDTHVHYSFDAWDEHPPASILEKFRNAGVHRALVSSTPDDGTLKLLEAAPETVVPNLRPYRTRADMSNWAVNQEVHDYVAGRIDGAQYRGIGEFHLFDPLEVGSPQIKALVKLAVERDLWLQVHSGAEPVRRLYALDPTVKIIWAHLGLTEPAEVVMEMFDAYPQMMGDTSFRAGAIAPGGEMDDAWRAILIKHSDKIMVGTDTYIPPRWAGYEELVEEHRGWLAQLPDEVARRIAYRNAVRLFGPGANTGLPAD